MVVGGTFVEGVINYEMPGSHGGDGCHFMTDEYNCGGDVRNACQDSLVARQVQERWGVK